MSQKISEGVLIHAIFNLPLARSHMYLTEPGCDRIKRLNRAVQRCVGYDAIKAKMLLLPFYLTMKLEANGQFKACCSYLLAYIKQKLSEDVRGSLIL